MDVTLTEFGSNTKFCGLAFSADTDKWYAGTGLGEISTLDENSANWTVVEDESDGVTSIAISPDGKDVMFGTSQEGHCRPLSDPADESSNKLSVRDVFVLRQIEYDSTGSHIFYCGENHNVTIYSCATQGQEASISSNDQGVRGFCLDITGEYLALVNGAGDLFVYQLLSQKGPLGRQYTGSNIECVKSAILPKDICRNYEQGFSMSFAQFNDSLLLTIPQVDGSPLVLRRAVERDGIAGKEVWSEIGPLVTDSNATLLTHLGKHVNLAAFSRNGRYLASADVSGRVLIWDMSRNEVLSAINSGHPLVAVKWGLRDGDNYLMLVSATGWARVDDVIKVNTGLAMPTGTTVTDQVLPALVSDKVVVDVAPKDFKRIRKLSGAVAATPSDDQDEFEFSAGVEEVKSNISKSSVDKLLDREAVSSALLDSDDDDDGLDGGIIVDDDDDDVAAIYDPAAVGGIPQFIQDPFQPSATTPDEKKRRYMVWNAVGTIISRDDDIGFRIEIKFADMSSTNKQESFADNYGFTMADMSNEGAVFAAPPDEPEPEHIIEDGMPPPAKTTGSVIFYRSFGNQMRIGGANENFTHTLTPGEEAIAVCAGSGWCAVATSKSLLRVFSSTGLQLSITLLKGPVVCLCGFDTCLAVVYNSYGCTVETPVLLVDMYDISLRRPLQAVVTDCILPLSARGTLAWAAFSEDRYLMALDSNGILCALISAMGWQWVPVFDTAALCRTVDHKVWPVVVKAERFCYALLHGERKPLVFPQPVVSARPFKLPMVETRDKTEGERMRDLLWHSVQLGHNEALKNQSLFLGGDAVCGMALSEIEDENYNMQLERDKLLIRHFHDCLKKQRVAGALDVMSRITTTEGLTNAIKVANALGKAALAKLLSELIVEKESEKEIASSHDTLTATAPSQLPVNPVVSSYHPATEEQEPFSSSFSQSQTQTQTQPHTSPSTGGYIEYKSANSPPESSLYHGYDNSDESDRRVGASRVGGSVLTGAKRRGPKGAGVRADEGHLPINKFAQSSIVSPFKKRRDVYESMNDLKGSPSPKKPPLQRDSSFAKEARSKILHDKSVI